MMIDIIKTKAETIENFLIKAHAPVMKYLQPGISSLETISICSKYGIVPNADIIELYEWRNGTKLPEPGEGYLEGLVEIIPFGAFYNLQYSLSEWTLFQDLDYFENAGSYLPIFGSMEQDLYGYKLDTGQIYFISPGMQIYGDLAFHSLSTMLDCIIACYQKEIFHIDPNKGLEIKNYQLFEDMKQHFLKE